MHPLRYRRLSLALLVLCSLAAVLMAGVVAWGMHLTLTAALSALVLSALIFAAMLFVHDALRAARWNAGHRLR